jgi:uncharacterized protein with ParB-like and HNH nuclease domain
MNLNLYLISSGAVKSPLRTSKYNSFYVPENDQTKMLVLDGQQRLQSLFIGLKGSYDKKE